MRPFVKIKIFLMEINILNPNIVANNLHWTIVAGCKNFLRGQVFGHPCYRFTKTNFIPRNCSEAMFVFYGINNLRDSSA